MLFMLLLLNAAAHKMHSSEIKTMQFSEITGEIFQDPTAVVELTAGERIPLYFWIKGDLLALDMNKTNAPDIVVQKTFYVKCVDETFLFSSDKHNWKEWCDFATGTFGVSVPGETGDASVTLYLEADERL